MHEAAADGPRAYLHGAVGIATENVGRGISYSREKLAAFGRLGWRYDDFELLASAITVSGSADMELAVAARFYFELADFKFRAQIERTAYPGAAPNIDYWEFGLNVRREWNGGAIDLGLRHSSDDSGGAQYVFIDLSQQLLSVTAGNINLTSRLGWRPYDDNATAGRPDYAHWALGLEYVYENLRLDVTYHDTDIPTGGTFPADTRVVMRATYAFSFDVR